ncbi:MAG: hypothetical protein LBQ28_02060 [Prevotellaceae bacterium]|jgi:hypothetical protein|nr:hypothetical protein [Prevotellaceae bacterium]
MKTIKLTTTVTLLAIVLLAATCKKYDFVHRHITIINKSHEDIAYQGFAENMQTFFHCQEPGVPIPSVVWADSVGYFESPIRPHPGWEYFLDEGQTLNILIGNLDLFNQYNSEPCDTFHKYVPVIHSYHLTLGDLQRMNWTVVYPPEE